MSFLHPEEARQCKRCDHIWFAEKWTSARKPIVGTGLSARQQDLHIQIVHQERKSHLKAYKQCPSCGSKKVKTISKKVAEAAVHRTQPSATAGPPPGWYPPSDGGPPRYWDGQRWTASGP